jgi:DNA-binding phage protein
MSTKIKTFDVAEFLQDEETMAEYLNMALADPNPDMLRLATDNIVRARLFLERDSTLGFQPQ